MRALLTFCASTFQTRKRAKCYSPIRLVAYATLALVALSGALGQASTFEFTEENKARLQAAIDKEVAVRREECPEIYRVNAIYRSKEMFYADIEGCEKFIERYPAEAKYKYRLFRNYLWPANELVDEDRFVELLQFIRERAKRADPEAIAILADVYAVGHKHIESERIEKDPQKALEYYRKAAGMENCWAMARLGEFHLGGEFGVAKNIDNKKLGYDYYELAADCGHPDAISQVASFYRFGVRWLPRYKNNITRAIELYERAGALGYWRAYGYLVDIYGFDEDELFDPKKAAQWFCKLPLKWRLRKWWQYYDGRKKDFVPLIFDFISCEYREVENVA